MLHCLPPPLRPRESPLPRSTGPRGAARLRLAIPVRLVEPMARETCVLLDLSRSGARIGLKRPMGPGTAPISNSPEIEAFAEVVRRHVGESGGVTALPLSEPLPDAAVLEVAPPR